MPVHPVYSKTLLPDSMRSFRRLSVPLLTCFNVVSGPATFSSGIRNHNFCNGNPVPFQNRFHIDPTPSAAEPDVPVGEEQTIPDKYDVLVVAGNAPSSRYFCTSDPPETMVLREPDNVQARIFWSNQVNWLLYLLLYCVDDTSGIVARNLFRISISQQYILHFSFA